MGRFQTTVWDIIAAARDGESIAVQAFVDRYRPPLIEFVGLQGLRGQDAEDIAQEVFLRLFSRDLLERVDPKHGRFRSYLLAITRNVLSEHRKRETALKRGGDLQRVALTDTLAAVSDPSFDACWCRDLLRRALDGLRLDDPSRYEVLVLRLLEELPYPEVAKRTGKPVEHVRVDVHRAKKRLVRLVKQEIATYCASQEEYREELETFLAALEPR